jgi:ATP-dependent Lhr-like helicase
LHELGDLTTPEIFERAAGDAGAWIAELERAGRIVPLELSTAHGTATRWVPAERVGEYGTLATNENILRRWMNTAGPLTQGQVLARYAFDPLWLSGQLDALAQTGALVRGHFTRRDQDEYVDATLLEQIHRRTLNLLRVQVQPVSVYAYANLLARWQHAHPETRLAGENALANALKLLRGTALPGAVLEREILAARVEDYSGARLDEVFASGEWVWVAEGSDPRRLRVRLFERGEGALFVSPPDLGGLSEAARTVYEFLQAEGASFATDLQTGTRLGAEALLQALVELTLRGLITNDAVETLRNLIAHGSVVRGGVNQAAPESKPLSALEAELDARMGPRPLKITRYREAKRRTMDRIQRSLAQQASPWRGRWAPVHRAGILGTPRPEEARAEAWARLLLERYGVVTREVLQTEEAPTLELVYPVWQRMEWRGEVRRGIFVAGLSGIQYALPEAVERLRAAVGTSADTSPGAPPLYVLNATDPANLFGGETSEVKFARVPSTELVLGNGQPVLLAQDSGARLTLLAGADETLARAALRELFTRPAAPRHAIVTEWNGAPVLGGAGEALLKELGFYRMPKGMERWER